MLIAGAGRRGPFNTHDLPEPGAYDPHAPALRPVDQPLVARAATFYVALDRGDERRAQVGYCIQRLIAGPIDGVPMLADRLADIIRPRSAGSFG